MPGLHANRLSLECDNGIICQMNVSPIQTGNVLVIVEYPSLEEKGNISANEGYSVT
jgi:hypothetical protein